MRKWQTFRKDMVLLVTILYGCAPALIKMEKEDLMQLQNQPEVGAVHYDTPTFGDATHGLYGLSALKERYGGGLIFDFKTMGWGIGVRSGFSTDQYLGYAVRARLIRNAGSKILWQGLCKFETEDVKRREFTTNNAALLKAKLQEASNTCPDDLWSQFQGAEPRTK